jgi:CBS domain-containing protein
MKVRDLMTRQVATVQSTDPASVALKLMWDCDCGAVPVLDESQRLTAIVTDRDIGMTVLFRDSSPSAIPVSAAMSKNLHYCRPEDSVSSAEKIMRAHQIRRLPVLNADGRLVGILSLADIVRATAPDNARAKDMIPEEVTATLADICTRRQSDEASARP